MPGAGRAHPDAWGVTASDGAKGYLAWGGPPMDPAIDGYHAAERGKHADGQRVAWFVRNGKIRAAMDKAGLHAVEK
jgi:hypothetical protein